MVAILVASICALIKEYGGFAALLYWIKKVFKGRKGGLLGMVLLVGLMILQRRIIQSQLLWQIQLHKKCQETTESAIRKQHLFWIHFPVSFREFFLMEHRCWLPSQRLPAWVRQSVHLIFCQGCFTRICCSSVPLSLFLLKKMHNWKNR